MQEHFLLMELGFTSTTFRPVQGLGPRPGTVWAVRLGEKKNLGTGNFGDDKNHGNHLDRRCPSCWICLRVMFYGFDPMLNHHENSTIGGRFFVFVQPAEANLE